MQNKSLGFLYRIGFVSCGLALGAILAFVTIPFLTRIYTIEDFGTYGLTMAIVSLLSSVICLKMEQAILVCQEEHVSSIVFYVFVFILLIFSFSLILGYFFYKSVFVVACAVLTNAIVQLTYSIYLKSKKELKCGLLNFSRVAFLLIPQVFLPFFINEPSLLYGLYAQFLLVTAFYGRVLFKAILADTISFKKFIIYKNFAKKNTLHSIVNSVSNNMPYYFLSYFYGLQVVGYYALVDRVLKVPVSLFSQVLRQTFIRDFSKSKNKAKTALKAVTVSKYMLAFYLPFLVVLAFLPVSFYSSIFGGDWESLGGYFLVLGIGYSSVFMNPPTSAWLISNQLSSALLNYQVIEFLMKFIGLLFCSYLFVEIYALLIITISLVFYNLLIFIRVYKEI